MRRKRKVLQREQMRILIEAVTVHQQQHAPNEWQVKWLAFMRSYRSLYYDFDEQEAAEDQMNRLRCKMALKEAEGAERMAGEL